MKKTIFLLLFFALCIPMLKVLDTPPSRASSVNLPSSNHINPISPQPTASKQATSNISKHLHGCPTGKLNEIYRVNTDYTNDDGSFIVLNFQSIKKYKTYKTNNGEVLKNVVVLQNVTPISTTLRFINKVGSFDVENSSNNRLRVKRISTQENDLSEIILELDNVTNCKYVYIGGFDSTLCGDTLLRFDIK